MIFRIFFLCFSFTLISSLTDYSSLRDSLSAEIEFRSTQRPIILLLSSDVTEVVAAHLSSHLHLSSSSIRCFNLLESRPEDDLKFSLHTAAAGAGAIAIFTGMESLTSFKIPKMNFLHGASDSVSPYANLWIILVWDQSIRPLTSGQERNELNEFLALGGSVMNTQALVGRISRILVNHVPNSDQIKYLCSRYQSGGDSASSLLWTLVLILVVLVSSIFFLFPRENLPTRPKEMNQTIIQPPLEDQRQNINQNINIKTNNSEQLQTGDLNRSDESAEIKHSDSKQNPEITNPQGRAQPTSPYYHQLGKNSAANQKQKVRESQDQQVKSRIFPRPCKID